MEYGWYKFPHLHFFPDYVGTIVLADTFFECVRKLYLYININIAIPRFAKQSGGTQYGTGTKRRYRSLTKNTVNNK